MLCRPKEDERSGKGGLLLVDEGSLKLAPTLCEYMSQTVWDDGKPRETSSVMVVWEDGQWKGGLLDRELGRNLWVTSPSLKGLWEALEKRLAAPIPDWRKKKEYPARKR